MRRAGLWDAGAVGAMVWKRYLMAGHFGRQAQCSVLAARLGDISSLALGCLKALC